MSLLYRYRQHRLELLEKEMAGPMPSVERRLEMLEELKELLAEAEAELKLSE